MAAFKKTPIYNVLVASKSIARVLEASKVTHVVKWWSLENVDRKLYITVKIQTNSVLTNVVLNSYAFKAHSYLQTRTCKPFSLQWSCEQILS